MMEISKILTLGYNQFHSNPITGKKINKHEAIDLINNIAVGENNESIKPHKITIEIMARISTYQRDTVVTKNDKVIGTDSSGSITKNFKLEDIAGFFSNTNAIGIATQFNFKFVDSARGIQTISFDPIAPGNTFNNVTSFVLSKFDANNNNVSEYLFGLLEAPNSFN